MREGSNWLSRDPRVPSYANAEGAGLSTYSQGRFEENFRSCLCSFLLSFKFAFLIAA